MPKFVPWRDDTATSPPPKTRAADPSQISSCRRSAWVAVRRLPRRSLPLPPSSRRLGTSSRQFGTPRSQFGTPRSQLGASKSQGEEPSSRPPRLKQPPNRRPSRTAPHPLRNDWRPSDDLRLPPSPTRCSSQSESRSRLWWSRCRGKSLRRCSHAAQTGFDLTKAPRLRRKFRRYRPSESGRPKNRRRRRNPRLRGSGGRRRSPGFPAGSGPSSRAQRAVH